MKILILGLCCTIPGNAFAACSDYNIPLLRLGVALSKSGPGAHMAQASMDSAMLECYGGTPVYYQYKALQMQEEQIRNQQRMYEEQQSRGITCTAFDNIVHCQ